MKNLEVQQLCYDSTPNHSEVTVHFLQKKYKEKEKHLVERGPIAGDLCLEASFDAELDQRHEFDLTSKALILV